LSKFKQKITILWLFLLLLGLIACSKRYHDLPAYLPFNLEGDDNYSVGRFKTSFLAEQMDHFFRGTDPGPIAITTFVSLDNLYATSSFGRIYSEQLLSELVMKGYDVVEIRQGNSIQFLKSEGEYRLTRELDKIRNSVELGGIIVGTYSVSPDRVYINARLLDPNRSLVLSAASVEITKTAEIDKLLRKGGSRTKLERVPFHNLSISPNGFSPFPYSQNVPSWPPINQMPEIGKGGNPMSKKREPLELLPPKDLQK
jgi:TolB-like protein